MPVLRCSGTRCGSLNISRTGAGNGRRPSGYNQVVNVTHCGCWAHVRRKWREAMPEGATVKTSKAAVGFQYCNKLFAEERKRVSYKPQYRQECHQNIVLRMAEHSASGEREQTGRSGSIHPEPKAAAHGISCDGEVPISNNLAENVIRPFTVGRKNWLFCDTPKGAEASATDYSLVESAKANGIEPFAYLQHMWLRLPYFGRLYSHQEL